MFSIHQKKNILSMPNSRYRICLCAICAQYNDGGCRKKSCKMVVVLFYLLLLVLQVAVVVSFLSVPLTNFVHSKNQTNIFSLIRCYIIWMCVDFLLLFIQPITRCMIEQKVEGMNHSHFTILISTCVDGSSNKSKQAHAHYQSINFIRFTQFSG